MIKWLLQHYKTQYRDVKYDILHAIHNAYQNNHTQCARLVNIQLPVALDSTDSCRELLRAACAEGRTLCAQWIARISGQYIPSWPKSDLMHTLQYVLANGHISTAQWLIKYFDLSPHSLRFMFDPAIRDSTSAQLYMRYCHNTDDNIINRPHSTIRCTPAGLNNDYQLLMGIGSP
jgi:hypothetical protein